jgi:hypothetical protein
MTTTTTRTALRLSLSEVVLRVLTVVGLGVSGYIHLHLAHLYAGNGGTVSQGDLFIAQGVVAAVVALVLLLTGWRWSWYAAGLVGAASAGALLLSRYTSLGGVGPLPNMHDASWQPAPDKVVSLLAECAVVALVAVWAVTVDRRRDRQPVLSSSP